MFIAVKKIICVEKSCIFLLSPIEIGKNKKFIFNFFDYVERFTICLMNNWEIN